MTPSEFEELAAAYSLGVLKDEEKKQFELYLRHASDEEKHIVAEFKSMADFLGISTEFSASQSQEKSNTSPPTPEDQNGNYISISDKEGQWKRQSEGISVKVLYQNHQTYASTTLVHIEAGYQLHGRTHAMVKEMYILRGSCICAGKLLKAGDYHRTETGSLHPIISTQMGCMLLLLFRPD